MQGLLILLAAETPPVTTENIIAVILQNGGVGALSVVLWILLNRLTSNQEKLTTVFSTEQDANRKLFEAEQDANRETFKAELKAERITCDEHFKLLTDALGRNQEALLRSNFILEKQQHLLEEHHHFAKDSIRALQEDRAKP